MRFAEASDLITVNLRDFSLPSLSADYDPYLFIRKCDYFLIVLYILSFFVLYIHTQLHWDHQKIKNQRKKKELMS